MRRLCGICRAWICYTFTRKLGMCKRAGGDLNCVVIVGCAGWRRQRGRALIRGRIDLHPISELGRHRHSRYGCR